MTDTIFTPQFIKFCKANYDKLAPFTASNVIRPFPAADAAKMLKEVEGCNEYQLKFLNDFIIKAKKDVDTRLTTLGIMNGTEKATLAQYKAFFAELENKLNAQSKKTGNSAQNIDNSSYKPKALQGQSFYDSMMHILGYNAETVGSSAIFYLLFQGLKFLVGAPYWEQVSAYNAAPKKQFNPEKLTEEQIKWNLHKESTREEILEAGFLPAPDFANACELEFKTFSQKMGSISKQSEGKLNTAGAALVNRK